MPIATLRAHQVDSGGVRASSSVTRCSGPGSFPRSKHKPKSRWKAAGAKDGESLEAHRLDAFIDLLAASGGTGSGRGAQSRPSCSSTPRHCAVAPRKTTRSVR